MSVGKSGTGQMSSVKPRQMSAAETGQMSEQQQTSVLSRQTTSVLSQQDIVCVSETSQGPDTCNRDGSRQPYSNFSNQPHPPRQNRGAVQMGITVWRVAEKPKKIKWHLAKVSAAGHGPKSAKVVGNGPRMVARRCQGSPEVPVDLKRGLQTAPGPGEAANGQIQRNRGAPPTSSTVGSAAWRSHLISQTNPFPSAKRHLNLHPPWTASRQAASFQTPIDQTSS